MTLVAFARRSEFGSNPELLAALGRHLSDADVVEVDRIDSARLGDVRVAVVDGPSAAQLDRLVNLEFVQSTWAGVEEVLPVVPPHVSVARMIDPQLADTMAEAVTAWTLYLHRDMPRYARQQRERAWRDHPLVPTFARRVGVAGLGVLGARAAAQLSRLGFSVSGWSRTPKSIGGVRCLDGDAGFDEMLATSNIVVNLLPHTEGTTGIFDAHAFAAMPSASSLVNFGRGSAVVDADLLAALDSGHVDHAVLDVFDTEPLPMDHPYWTHASVTVLPHISGPTTVETAAVIAARNVERYLDTGVLPDVAVVDRERGY
jgi:glyoxylate/hydroxypyruvate reductase A